MKFTNFLASTLMVSAAYSAVVPTKSEEIHVDKRTQYTLQGLVSELLTHAVVDTASLFGHALQGGILTLFMFIISAIKVCRSFFISILFVPSSIGENFNSVILENI